MGQVNHERILIWTGRYGEGHRQAALALKESYEEQFPGSDVQVVDYMEWMHPNTHELGRLLFVKGMTILPSVYGFLFEQTRKPGVISRSMHVLARFAIPRMKQLLDQLQPTLVVSTFPPAASAMSMLKERGIVDIPTVTVITDHTDHSYWVHSHTDRYLVGSDRVRLLLQAQGVPAALIRVTGIPLRRRFALDQQLELLRGKHGLRGDLPTVLLMGGGCGIIDKHLLMKLESDSLPGNLQLVVICGHNRKRQEQLTRHAAASRHRILPIGFVDCMEEWMAMADLVITKPGGLSTSEAIAMQLPMLLYRPLPGQEEDNAQFLTQAGVAIRAEGELDLILKLQAMLASPERLAAMRERASALDMGHSSSKAAAKLAYLKTTSFSRTNRVGRSWALWRHKRTPAFSRLK